MCRTSHAPPTALRGPARVFVCNDLHNSMIRRASYVNRKHSVIKRIRIVAVGGAIAIKEVLR